MRIGIDIRCLAKGRITGVEEYTLNLLEALFSLDKNNQYILFFNSFRKPKANFDWATRYPNVTVKTFRFPNKLLNLFFWYLEWPKIDKLIGGVDLFFMPNTNFGSFSYYAKLIMTKHDLSLEMFPETFTWKRRWRQAFIFPKKLSRKAKRIVTVSDSTKTDLINIYGLPPEKICVIRSGVADKFSPLSRNKPQLMSVKSFYGLPYKFILYLGTIEPRKNIVALVEAYEQLRKINHPQLEKYKLVIAGAKGWKFEKILQRIALSPFKKDILLPGYVKDEDKPALYNLASLFVYPSIYEGFGFPVAEAMKCRVPVITSNVSSLPEVVNNGGLLVDPDKPEEIFLAMKEILLNRTLAESLIEKGASQAAHYSWSGAAKELLLVFERVASKR